MWGNEVNRRSASVHTVQQHATTLKSVGLDKGKYSIWHMVVQIKRERHGLLIVHGYNVHNCQCHMSQLENTKHYDERDAEYN